ncbi:oligosaccharide translocation protein rft1, putative [Entamoeba invadens IP1]|uniref:Protein RFT1 homolog n=2 Tax=Entamoeba invadens TaxID=33085 RepID=A0A0A1U4F3_ENTIV|nr:oligosaccharide translocation protein rft1, putative [Entamoeba invadens IP1]BAN41224.1 oligosaccharide translocation protein rft1, putative [Entamoeba invadens]ELP86580.1 oligosaccharide translocation protein rft1, putative [Entamoeba invadens IP1]BAN41225.1 oligosaccharide translocation protein rft1, putative [Entamoeba invadens]BAN41707.1 oligosaccharide translocation protein rft1, putative [Entamoeba invadens]BAN41746.1 oligosaccharide translocation protein rft1, putative [Entamoeba inv|eukprot:XP_004185926.1 oligosaccharide translocation protein rft1, putative [Entamoeba invadens IP1]
MSAPTTQTIGGALRGIASSVLFQLLQRTITFISNVIVIRSVSEEVTGFFHIHLQLLMNVVYFLSREFSRRTIMRKHTDDLSKGVSFSLITIPVGLLINMIALPLIYSQAPPMEYALTSYVIHSFGLFLELIQEPYLVYMLLTQQHIFRLYAELPSILLRNVLQAILIPMYPQYALLIQPSLFVLNSVLVFITYFFIIKLPKIDLSVLGWKSLKEHKDCINLFGRQTIQKFLLQEGEKAVLVVTTNLSTQGVFSVISNISSLIVRFLFLPIEEVSFSLFSKMRMDKGEVLNAFYSMMKILVHLMLFVLVFGPTYSKPMLEFLYNNEEYTNSWKLMVIAFIGIAAIGLNGISESFFQATASDEQLSQANNFMFVFSGGYVVCCIAFSKLFGVVGLLLANISAMAMRTVYSHYNIYLNFGALCLKNVLPSFGTLVSFIMIFTTNVFVSMRFIFSPTLCLFIGGCLGLLQILAIVICDKPFVATLVKFWNDKNAPKDQK